MEKILEFKKGKIFDEASKLYRFQCDCLSAKDAMDIMIDSWGRDDEGKFFTITMDFLGIVFWDRLKYAMQIIRGHWTWREFVVREEDTKHLSNIFNPEKKFSALP